jgi:hypothetical protein
VHAHLRVQRVAEQPLGSRAGRGELVQRDAGFVAGGFDAEHKHAGS